MGSYKNRLTVVLTMDDDGETGFIDAGCRDKMSLSRGAYGAEEGMKRILQLIERQRLPFTCFIPGMNAERFPDQCKWIRDAGIEIGHHGYRHAAPEKLTFEQEKEDLERGLDALQKILGVRPVGYRAPWLLPSDHTYQLLVEYGFQYDASECGKDRPYFLDVKGKKLLELPGQLEWIDTPLFINFATEGFLPTPIEPKTVRGIWEAEFSAMYEADEDLYLIHTIHPWCIGHLSRLRAYEEFIGFMKSHTNVTFCTMSEVCEGFLKGSQ